MPPGGGEDARYPVSQGRTAQGACLVVTRPHALCVPSKVPRASSCWPWSRWPCARGREAGTKGRCPNAKMDMRAGCTTRTGGTSMCTALLVPPALPRRALTFPGGVCLRSCEVLLRQGRRQCPPLGVSLTLARPIDLFPRGPYPTGCSLGHGAGRVVARNGARGGVGGDGRYGWGAALFTFGVREAGLWWSG